MKFSIFFTAIIISLLYSFNLAPVKAQANFVSAAILNLPLKAQTDFSAPIAPDQAKMLFRREYSNYARGYHHNGWFINEKGDVYSYEYGRDPQDYTKLSFKTPPTLIGHIEPGILASKRLLIKKVVRGTFTSKHAAYDAGTGVYSAFLRDSRGGFKEIKLKSYGDVVGTNSAPETDKLVEWLKTVFTNPQQL